MKFYLNHFLTLCYVFKSKYEHLKFSKKIRCINELVNESKQTLKGHIKISECPEGFLKAQIEGFKVNFYISNKLVYTLDVELRYVVLKV